MEAIRKGISSRKVVNDGLSFLNPVSDGISNYIPTADYHLPFLIVEVLKYC